MLKYNRKIAVIGLGYVGLPLLKNLSGKLSCWGLDSNPIRISHINEEYPQLQVTSDWNDIDDCDFYIVAVPTPIDENYNPDVTPLKNVCTDLANVINNSDIIVFESTVYPGATEEICIPLLENLTQLKVNEDFYVGYSPERINVGDAEHQFNNTPKIISSTDADVTEVIKDVYESVLSVNVVKASSIKVAEAAKIYENVQRDVLIALANEFSEYCRLEGVDIDEVTKCASTKWNFSYVTPGLVGGHCIAVDPYYLIDRASKKGIELQLVKTAREVNEYKPEVVATRIVDLLSNQSKKTEHPHILLLGITYKANVPDCRNTKIPLIVQMLEERGIITDVYDPIADQDCLKMFYNVHLISNMEFKTRSYNLAIQMVDHNVFKALNFDNCTKYNLKELL